MCSNSTEYEAMQNLSDLADFIGRILEEETRQVTVHKLKMDKLSRRLVKLQHMMVGIQQAWAQSRPSEIATSATHDFHLLQRKCRKCLLACKAIEDDNLDGVLEPLVAGLERCVEARIFDTSCLSEFEEDDSSDEDEKEKVASPPSSSHHSPPRSTRS